MGAGGEAEKEGGQWRFKRRDVKKNSEPLYRHLVHHQNGEFWRKVIWLWSEGKMASLIDYSFTKNYRNEKKKKKKKAKEGKKKAEFAPPLFEAI